MVVQIMAMLTMKDYERLWTAMLLRTVHRLPDASRSSK